jgi:hypothetical protein
LIAGLLASALCSWSILRNRKPSWFHAFLSLLCGNLGSLTLIFGGDVLHPVRWPGRYPGQWDSVAILLAPSVPLTAVVVLVATALFQERFKRHLSRHERNILHRRRRERHWQRARWFHLQASSMLIIASVTSLIWLYSTPVTSRNTSMSTHYPGAFAGGPGPVPGSPGAAGSAPAKPLLEVSDAAALLSPFCVLGLAVSGVWLAFTVGHWRGDLRVRPRHRRDLLASARCPAKVR